MRATKRKPRQKTPEKISTRGRILNIAGRLFADNGYGLTSMRTIARTARIRVATLYYYFKSKKTLYRAVLEREQERMREVMNRALAEHEDFSEQVSDMMMSAFTYHQGDPTFLKLALRAFIGDNRNQPYSLRWLEGMEQMLTPAAVRNQIKEVHPVLFMITAGAIVSHHVFNLPLYEEMIGKQVGKKNVEPLVREHVKTMVLRCLGLEHSRPPSSAVRSSA